MPFPISGPARGSVPDDSWIHHRHACYEHEGVVVFLATWVQGFRACGYFGVVRSEIRGGTWLDLEACLRDLCEQAAKLSANAVVGLDATLDPFAREIVTTGTAAMLERT